MFEIRHRLPLLALLLMSGLVCCYAKEPVLHFPLPRDPVIAKLISTNVSLACGDSTFLEKAKITASVCQARVHWAAQHCPDLIKVGVPKQIDHDQFDVLVKRAGFCVVVTAYGLKYSNGPTDKFPLPASGS